MPASATARVSDLPREVNVVVMRISVLTPLLLLCLPTCVVPVEYEPWSVSTLRLASSVEQSGENLSTALLGYFHPGSEEYKAARQLGFDLQQEYARQVMAWRALEAYLADVDVAISRRAFQTHPVRGISKAFHELHIHLLQTGLAGSFGITVEQHQAATLRIMEANSVVAAMEAANPVIAILCENLSTACAGLVDELEAQEMVALDLLASQWRKELAVREVLLQRQDRLRDAFAMVAAGAGTVSGEPAADLVEVGKLLAANEESFQLYARQRRGLSETFRAHANFARKSSHAILEWGIGHREVLKALQRGDNHANLRLFNASVAELSHETIQR